jgi:hypothetical protein
VTRVRLPIGVILLKPPSLIGGDPPSQIISRGSMRDDVGRGVMSKPSQLGRGAILLLTHAGDTVVESCWQ